MRFSSFPRLRILFLVLGDMLALFLALYTALFVRFWSVPPAEVSYAHLQSFSPVFAASILIFFIAGLYDLHQLPFRKKVASLILYSEIVAAFFSVLFFYVLPVITPKTVLGLYLVFSFVLVSLFRLYGVSRIQAGERRPAVFIGDKKEGEELCKAVNGNDYYPFVIEKVFDIKSGEERAAFMSCVESKDVPIRIASSESEFSRDISPFLYRGGENREVLDATLCYEEVLGRVPLSSVTYNWFFQEVTLSSKWYLAFKRFMDIVISFPLFLLSLILFPLVYLAVKLDDGNEIFSVQNRIGKRGNKIKLYKIRTMSFTDEGKWLEENRENKVTRVGVFLRKSRIDELPQLWNVLRGDISLIGPRPDIIALGERLEKEIPFYELRYAVAPGLSGWAQVRQENQPRTVEDTKLRFAYDLYYVKNQSLLLDLHVALKTIKTLIMRTGM